MPTKPTSIVTWDITQANLTQPTAPHQNAGYAINEVPTSTEFNGVLNGHYQWKTYFESVTDETLGGDPTLNKTIGNIFDATTVAGLSSTVNGFASNGTGTIAGVTSDGKVIYSTDYGITWASQTVNGAEVYNDITYRSSGTLWTLVGNSGVIRTATNPSSTWTSRTSNTANNLLGVYDDGTTAVAVGASNTIRYQTNPTGSWSTGTSGLASTTLNDVVSSGSLWVIVANSGGIQTATTPSGTWTSRTSGVSTNLYAAEFANSQFVVGGAANAGVGTLLYSANGTTWSASTGNKSTGDIRRGAYNTNSSLWCMGQANGNVVLSSDGQNWLLKKNGSANNFAMVYNNNKRFILGGASGSVYFSDDIETLRDDLDTTTGNTTTNTNNIISNTASINTINASLSRLKLSNFETLTASTANAGVAKYGSIIQASTFQNTTSYVTGTPLILNASTTTSFFLNDLGPATIAMSASANLTVGATDGTTVAMGGTTGSLFTAPCNALGTQTSRTSNLTTINGMAFGNSNWVAVGNSIRYQTNPTGAWLTPTSVPAGTYNSVAYGATNFVTEQGGTSVYYTTTPSGTWSTNAAPGFGSNVQFIYFDGTYFWAGCAGVAPACQLYYTANPAGTWTTAINSNVLGGDASTTVAIKAMTYDGTTWAAWLGAGANGSGNGTVLISTDRTNWTKVQYSAPLDTTTFALRHVVYVGAPLNCYLLGTSTRVYRSLSW